MLQWWLTTHVVWYFGGGFPTKWAHSARARNESASVNYAPMAPASVDTSSGCVTVDVLELSHYEHCGAEFGGRVVEMDQG